MKEIRITSGEAGQRLDKLLFRYLGLAPGSFIYKMLRKKNIVLNDKKASGNERLKAGDCVKLYLSDDTVGKFSRADMPVDIPSDIPGAGEELAVVYEDEALLFVNKPPGILSQKASASDISMNELILSYLSHADGGDSRLFKPSVCNRLDRNTSGIIAAGKTLSGAQFLSRMFRERTLGKYYLCLVKGKPPARMDIEGYLTKDKKTNRVTVTKTKAAAAEARTTAAKTKAAEGAPSRIRTAYRVLSSCGGASLLEVHLITGKSHQIRAHLASIGHPIAGDHKYGDNGFNRYFREKYGLKSQLLHAYKLVFPVCEGEYSYLSGKELTAPLPALFLKILVGQGVASWELGNPEA